VKILISAMVLHCVGGGGGIAKRIQLLLRFPWLWQSLLPLLIITSLIILGEAKWVERTFAMVKPDGVRANHTDAIKEQIQAASFAIISQKWVHLNESAAIAFYAEHSNRAFFPSLIDFMTSGPVLAMVLEKPNAVAEWRSLIGPTDSQEARLDAPDSIRARYGRDKQNNCVHGSDSQEAAAREISFFFDEYHQSEMKLDAKYDDEL